MNEDKKRIYDLEERTAIFGQNIISLCKSMKVNNISGPLINQIIRSGTSIGANYMEANAASSKKDFINKISICKKECQETKHWLRMLDFYDNQLASMQALKQECGELVLIFGRIISSSRSKKFEN
ncbi:MAG: four helix bundle protein [Patescibacteria group bacterium]